MSFGDINTFSIEKVQSVTMSSGNPLSFLILGLVQFFYMPIIVCCVEIIYEFFSRPESFFQSQTDPLNNSKTQAEPKKKKKKNDINDFESSNLQPSCIREKTIENGSVWREDAAMVMERLGIFCHLEGERLQERFCSDEISELFDEKEPSLDEVKEAFDVFDENRDGFIDAIELQRVLCVLGFKEGSELHSCKNMIKSFDENGDGRIDFSEFVKFMENSFC